MVPHYSFHLFVRLSITSTEYEAWALWYEAHGAFSNASGQTLVVFGMDEVIRKVTF